jgi:DNA processing protein
VADHEPELAALVAVLTGTATTKSERTLLLESTGALAVLESRHGLLARAELDRARGLIQAWTSHGITVLPASDERYPTNLRRLGDRPPALFLRGQLRAGDERSVAVVGTRLPSALGTAAAHEAVTGLVGAGYAIVSGLAAGIDTVAHTATLAAGGRTVAVIGTGVDRSYPPQNRDLQQQIASRCAVVSCFPPGSPPTRRSFPIRNRVMSGLALATVIIEASATSGTRIQARTSLEQGRPVLLLEAVLEQDWAAELAECGKVHVIARPADVPDALAALSDEASLPADRNLLKAELV